MKAPHGVKPLHLIFDKVDKYIRKYDSNEYITVFHSDEKFEEKKLIGQNLLLH